MIITQAGVADISQIAAIVSESNKDVAKLFDINVENNPKHPSFYTKQWVASDMERGERYFLLWKNNSAIGCVAFEHPRPDTAYLNRLSVLPSYRHEGAGEMLVKHILAVAKEKDIKRVSIGIIAAHSLLKEWYAGLGFIASGTRTFDHLPFDVTYMYSEIK